LGVGAALGAGAQPKLGTGVELRLAADWRSGFGVTASGRWWWPTLETKESLHNAGVEISRWAIEGSGCWGLQEGYWTPRGCVGLEGGRLLASGVGGDPVKDRHRSWVAPLARVELGRGLGQGWLASFGVEGAVALRRPVFGLTVDGREVEVWTPSPLSLRGSLSLARRW